ncbi:hypothetical protein BD324DRAFT_611861 [Kockovaella imperatae]|uniref:Glycosyltransferase family 1 protein n=1 Tax=Kockovaella imperatae TaxID=4999 RepID=A0A1Y1URN7_9TREE|nr:hypothetical protein BD324DRAFT_611861 [Kockovaella imperatae]ORX40718.1 hypothetical protein BD324DRAFT_611861 [Kockovaella imperatae]
MSERHLVVVTGPGWGHVIPCVLIALKFAQRAPNLQVTLAAFPDTYSKLDEEMSRRHRETSLEVVSRVQWLEIKNELETDSRTPYEMFFLGLMVPSNQAGNTIGNRLKVPPSLVIYDTAVETIPTQSIVRGISNEFNIPYAPCLYLAPVLSAGSLRLNGKTEHGGRYESFFESLKENEDKGLSPSEAGRKAFAQMNGELLETPDLPPMYDYELHPGLYGRGFPARITPRVRAVLEARLSSDGFVTFGVEEIEPKSNELLRKTLAPMPLFAIGPQLDLQRWTEQSPKSRKGRSAAELGILEFLDKAQDSFGAKSTAYFCLGSQWWPEDRPELIQYLVETLLEAKPALPFLVSASAAGASLSEELRSRVEASGRGMIVSWAPQVAVLQHEAIRFFISHCGSGSTIEAIMAGVPIVAWPFTADQPMWATIICRVYSAGVQLYQVNSGMKGRPLAVGGIVHETEEAIKEEMTSTWSIMRSSKYDEMRGQISKLRDLLLESTERGETKKAMDSVVETYLS